jgi:NAD(P)-dependent dehydrogenase (short-subunit alcohol dehydrogenase family)
MDLSGKIVLVTGAQQGIGRGIALHCAAAGADVAVNWLDDESAAQAIADEIRAGGRRAFSVRGDVARLAEVEVMVAAVETQLGPIDLLVNNAGVFPRVPFLELSESDWDFVLGVNLKGTCFCAQAVAKRMVAAGRSGAIINLTSGAAYRGSPRGVHYCASKGGVVSLTRQMALELAPYRIRVNAIAPGLTDTAQPRYGSSEEEISAAAQTIPLGRIAQPEDIARTAVFLASDEAGFVTGQIPHVNGGGYLG